MKRDIGLFGRAMLLSLALGTVLVAVALSTTGSMDPTTFWIDAEPMNLAPLDAGAWLVAAGGVALALFIVLLVVPLAVLMPLAIVAVALVGVLLVLAGVLAVVFSPLIFGLLLIWVMLRLMLRLIRGDSGKSRAIGSATIAR